MGGSFFVFINQLNKMKRFISTKLYLALQEASKKGIDMDANVLQQCYDKFVKSVFRSRTAFTDKSAYHDALVYTRVEFATLPEVSGKKYDGLSAQDLRTH
jgi:hypothetical protein